MEPLSHASFRDRRVLVVDDDDRLRESMAGYLAGHGLPVDTACNGLDLERALKRAPVGVVLLDVLMPPGEDGLSICRRIAAADGPPVILMSDNADEVDRIVGLELGADDYLAKPCNPRELLARVRAVMRRRWGMVVAQVELAALFEGWRLDMMRRELRDPRGRRVDLPYAEYALLIALLERPQRVLSRERLIEYALRDGVSASDRAIDTRVCRLRRTLGPDMIQTVRQEGYIFTAKVDFQR